MKIGDNLGMILEKWGVYHGFKQPLRSCQIITIYIYIITIYILSLYIYIIYYPII